MWCLRKGTDGRRGRLICRVSSYDNQLISFSKLFLNPSVDLVRFSRQMHTNLTFFHDQRKALSQSQRNFRNKDTFTSVHVWLPSVLFYQDEFKEWMCLPLLTWSSVALATPDANSKRMRVTVLMISLRLQFNADIDTIEMCSELEIEIL